MNENRDFLAAIESIEATIEIIDVEMGKEPEYLTVGKTPLERVHKLLSKLNSIRVSQDRGSTVSKEAEVLLNKFVQHSSNRLCKTWPEQGEDIKSISEQKRLQDLNRYLTGFFKAPTFKILLISIFLFCPLPTQAPELFYSLP